MAAPSPFGVGPSPVPWPGARGRCDLGRFTDLELFTGREVEAAGQQVVDADVAVLGGPGDPFRQVSALAAGRGGAAGRTVETDVGLGPVAEAEPVGVDP